MNLTRSMNRVVLGRTTLTFSPQGLHDVQKNAANDAIPFDYASPMIKFGSMSITLLIGAMYGVMFAAMLWCGKTWKWLRRWRLWDDSRKIG